MENVFVKLKYLSLPLLIHITRKDAVCGRHRHQEKGRRWAGWGEKGEAILTGVRERFMIGLTVWD